GSRARHGAFRRGRSSRAGAGRCAHAPPLGLPGAAAGARSARRRIESAVATIDHNQNFSQRSRQLGRSKRKCCAPRAVRTVAGRETHTRDSATFTVEARVNKWTTRFWGFVALGALIALIATTAWPRSGRADHESRGAVEDPERHQ